MDITAFIRELLFGHDCVIVPGFGGFIGNYTPAKTDRATGMFSPPVKQISFNRNLNHNDGLLIRQITAVSGITYGDARNLVAEFVSETRKKLSRGERVVFDKIGTFINNQEGNVQFEPDQSVNYNLDSYGLESFQCFPLEGYDARRRITISGNPVHQSSLRKYLWRAAVLIPVASILAVVSLKTDFLKSGIEATTMNPLVAAELEENKATLDNKLSILPDAFNTAPEQTPAELITTEIIPEEKAGIPAKNNTTVETPVAEVTSSAAYYIITGSFRSEENAGKQLKQLQAEGYNPEIVEAGNGFYRVCAMACPDLNTAVSRKDSILDKFPGSWVSRRK